MKTSAEVSDLLASLPAHRRQDVECIRNLIIEHLKPGYEEAVTKGMLVYQVPLAQYSDTYNGQPLWYVALGSTKNYLSLHLMSMYGDEAETARLRRAFQAAGKRLNAGKACIRFQTAGDLPLAAIGESIARMPVDRWIAIAKAARTRSRDTGDH